MRKFLPLLLLAALPPIMFQAHAANSTSAPAVKSLVPGFASGVPGEFLWYGVDSTGRLAGNIDSLPVLAVDGVLRNEAMPISVAVADMNGDGLLDIVAMDPLGYMWIYFNSGTKTQPKFTTGALSTLYLARMSSKDPVLPTFTDDYWWIRAAVRAYARRGPRISLVDSLNTGKNDLVVGNYFGEIFLIPNSGSVKLPDFRQPPDITKAAIPTAKNPMEKWGNLFSPAVWDWNKDGRWDLLVGEGSYSANSIHLLINKGSNDHPVFDESNRSVIAYGMGLEQISPCVVDYNGDGLPDLLVTERSGKVAVYLNNGTPWKPGETLEFDSFIKAGVPFAKNESGTKPSPMDAAKGSGLLSLGGICTITAADLNGDGLFDLIFGKSNGRIAVAYNTGTKEHPKFSNPVEITSEFKNALVTVPDNWLADSGLGRGNFLGAITLVKAEEDPGATGLVGARCLKAGYVPWLNTIMPSPKQYTPALSDWDRVMCSSISDWTLPSSPANYYHLKFPKDYKKSFPLKVKTPYVLSMRVRGTGVSEGAVYVHYYAQDTPQQGKVVRGGRNAATVVGEIKFEERKALEIMKFTVSPQWCEITKEFTVIPEKKELKDVQQIEVDAWALHISFDLAPGTGVIYIDDFKMIEK